jgi:hypothetical protein
MPDIRNKRHEYANPELYVQPTMRPPVPAKGRGRTPNYERNAAFLAEWDARRPGQGQEIAERYGYKNWKSAAVVAHRIRRYGKVSSWPAVPAHGTRGVRQ